MPLDHATILRDLVSKAVTAIDQSPTQLGDNGILLSWSTAPDGTPCGLLYVIGQVPLNLVKGMLAQIADADALRRRFEDISRAAGN